MATRINTTLQRKNNKYFGRMNNIMMSITSVIRMVLLLHVMCFTMAMIRPTTTFIKTKPSNLKLHQMLKQCEKEHTTIATIQQHSIESLLNKLRGGDSSSPSSTSSSPSEEVVVTINHKNEELLVKEENNDSKEEEKVDVDLNDDTKHEKDEQLIDPSCDQEQTNNEEELKKGNDLHSVEDEIETEDCDHYSDTDDLTSESDENDIDAENNSDYVDENTMKSNSLNKEEDHINNTTEKEILEKSSSSSSSYKETINLKQNEACDLRIQGKQLHDDGDFKSAAQTFQKAAQELDFVITIYEENLYQNENCRSGDSHYGVGAATDDEDESLGHLLNHSELLKIAEERATCRLHEALCHLKNKNYAESIISCTDVLMDGVEIVPIDEEDEVEGEKEEEGDNKEKYNEKMDRHQAVVVRLGPSGGGGKTAIEGVGGSIQLSTAVRARAYHRRAKARLAFGDTTGALDDAKSASFLGDRNAVALYGKLMRESGTTSNMFGGSSGEGSGLGDLNSLFSSSSPLDSLFSGLGSGQDSSVGNSPQSSFNMMDALLSGSAGDGATSANPLSALGGLGSMLNGNNSGASNMDSLVKSVLSSVTKRIEDKSTQEMVCKYLNGLNTPQLRSLSSMAGVSLGESTTERIVGFANGVTPKGIQKSIKLLKKIIFVGNVLQKTIKVIGKYKHLLVLVILIAWVKSAILRPVIPKVSKKAAKKAVEALSKSSLIIY